MKYRLGEVQNISHGRDAHVGFNILDAHGAPIVMFSYLDRADADKARALVEQAIAGAVVVKAFPLDSSAVHNHESTKDSSDSTTFGINS